MDLSNFKREDANKIAMATLALEAGCFPMVSDSGVVLFSNGIKNVCLGEKMSKMAIVCSVNSVCSIVNDFLDEENHIEGIEGNISDEALEQKFKDIEKNIILGYGNNENRDLIVRGIEKSCEVIRNEIQSENSNSANSIDPDTFWGRVYSNASDATNVMKKYSEVEMNK